MAQPGASTVISVCIPARWQYVRLGEQREWDTESEPDCPMQRFLVAFPRNFADSCPNKATGEFSLDDFFFTKSADSLFAIPGVAL